MISAQKQSPSSISGSDITKPYCPHHAKNHRDFYQKSLAFSMIGSQVSRFNFKTDPNREE